MIFQTIDRPTSGVNLTQQEKQAGLDKEAKGMEEEAEKSQGGRNSQMEEEILAKREVKTISEAKNHKKQHLIDK